MTTKKQEAQAQKKEGKITLQNWQLKNNIPAMYLAGFRAEIENTDKEQEYDEKKLDKDYKKYLDKPVFT